MESLERKDTNPVPEEPIKSEGMVPSPSTSDRSNSNGSPPPHCSICLGKLINTSFTDSCLHQFCFTCLLQWSKIKTECPLCKQTFKSIIHNVRSEGDYDQYDVNLQSVPATLDVAVGFPTQQWELVRRNHLSPLPSPPRNFMYRTTMAPHHRRFNPLLNADAVARREQIPSHAPQVSREEIRRRNVDPLEFRRQIYRQGIWARDLPDAFGRFRESSAEYYTRHPIETHRLVPWLNRELQVLLNNNRTHIAYVMTIIMDTIKRYNITSPQFRNVVRPYFVVHSDHFVHEFSNFARSNFDMVGYDQSVIYQPHRGLTNDFALRTVSPSSSSVSDSDSDSDVRLVEDDRDNRLGMDTLSVDPHMIDMPGPSTIGHALRLTMPRVLAIPSMPPLIYTISSTSSESENDCEVIGYVKPRHERTPEIIDLDSDENEAIIPGPSTSAAVNPPEVPLPVVEEVVPGPSIPIDLNISRRTRQLDDDASRCCMYEYFSSSSEPNTDESDSDYNPQSKSRRRKKKSSKSSPRKLRTRKHKKSTGAVRKRDKSRRERAYSEAESEATDMPSTSRGTKRYISDHSESEKPTKKSKKSKKAKSSKKSKKSKSKTSKYIEYRSCSSSTSSESETESRVKKKEDTYEYSKEEKEPRYAESECSSRLRIDENSHSSDGNDNGEDDDIDIFDEYSNRKVKSVAVAAAASARGSHSSESEHSASTKISRGRYRSHKKHKESKKSRRARS